MKNYANFFNRCTRIYISDKSKEACSLSGPSRKLVELLPFSTLWECHCKHCHQSQYWAPQETHSFDFKLKCCICQSQQEKHSFQMVPMKRLQGWNREVGTELRTKRHSETREVSSVEMTKPLGDSTREEIVLLKSSEWYNHGDFASSGKHGLGRSYLLTEMRPLLLPASTSASACHWKLADKEAQTIPSMEVHIKAETLALVG